MSGIDYGAAVDSVMGGQGPGAPLAPPSNVVPFKGPVDYGAATGQVMDMQHGMAVQNLADAQGTDPDRAAKALAVSRQTGIPQPAAEENLEQATQAADMQKNVQALRDNPGLSSFVAANPLAARIAQDDFDKLGFLDKMTTALISGASSAMLSNELGRQGSTKQAANLIGVEAPGTDQRIASLQGQLSTQPKLNGALGVAQNFTGFITGLVDNAIQGGTKGAIYGAGAGAVTGAVIGAPAAGVGAVPGAAAGATAGFFAGGVAGFNVDMAQVAAGNAYLKMSQMRGSDGQPLSEVGKQFGAIFTGAATYAIGTYAAKIESKLFGETAESLASKAMEKAVQSPTFTRAVGEFAGSTLKGAAQGAGIMTAMEASSIIGEQVAKAASSGDFGTDAGEIVDRLSDAAINGAVLLGTMHGAMRGLSLYGDARNAIRAQGQAEMLRNIMTGATESKLRERDLQGFQDFMQRQTDGSPVENLYIPADKVRELYQGVRADPFAFVPDMQKQLEEAAGTGGDVVIPTADFVTHLAGTPLAEHLLPDMRVGPDAMSLNEAKQFQAEYQKRIEQAADEASKAQTVDSLQRIQDEVQRQAVAAGRSETEGRQVGALLSARYATRAERRGLGEDPLALYQAEGPTIAADGAVTASDGRALSQAKRGRVSFSNGAAVIGLFKDADASTLVHESGHTWLEELAADANRPDAPRQLKDDLTTVQEWLGHEGGEFTDEQHEQFARGAERYLMEGKAPGTVLARVFSRFKQWLTRLYRTVDNLNSPINDDIRAVFDRLLATDSEIAEARQTVGLEPNFKDRAEAGMTQAEWGAYLRAIDKANTQAETTLLDKMMGRVRRQRGAEYREERTRVADQVAQEVDAQPDMQALNLLRSGKMPDGTEQKVKLSSEDLKRIYGAEFVKDLPSGIASKDGAHPDYVAEMLGFDSGDALVQSLKTLQDQQREVRKTEGEKRTIRQYQIDTETDRRMAARKGELEDEAGIKDEAMAAVHGEGRAELLAVELRYLRRMGARELESKGAARKPLQDKLDAAKQEIGDLKETDRWNDAEEHAMAKALRESVAVTKPMLEALRAHVDTLLSTKTTADVGRFATFLRDERKAAREVEQAILKKDWAAAAAAKQRQIVSHILYTRAKEASAEVDRGEATFKRLTSKAAFKGIEQAYTDQIHDLLARFGFDSGRGEELQRGKTQTLQEFVSDLAAERAIEPAVDPALYDMQGKPLADLTMAEFRALHEAVDSLNTLGRSDKLIEIDGVKRDIGEVKGEIVAAIRALGERAKSDFYDPRDAGAAAAWKEKLFGLFRGIDASLVKPEALFDQIDRADPLGIMNTAVFRPLKDAQGREDRWQQAASADLRDAVKSAGKGWAKRLGDVVPDDAALVNPETGRPMKLTRKRMLSMALNWGNEGNRTKLADGYKWSPTAIKAFLDRNMTKADWDFAQRVWKMFDAHKQDLDDLQRRVTGVGLDMVQADGFDTPHGRYEGGYYPIVYDAGKSFSAETHAEKATDALFPNGYTRATTPKGSTISRVEGVKRPIQLSLDVAPWKIGQVLHDLAFREAIINADRLLSSDSVKKAMDDVFGSEYRKLLRPWLKHIANSRNIDDAAITWIDKAISTARTNTVIVGIGFRLSTVLKHGLSALSNSANEVGPLNLLKATKDFYGPGMAEKWKFITDRSADMGFRLNAYDKDVTSHYDALIKDSTYTAVQKAAQHYGHIAISYLDLGSAAPTWMAAYTKAIGEGTAEKDAIYIADKTVRNAHGAQGITDSAQIQRAKGAANLINMFYGFFNHIYNRQRVIAMDAASGVKNVKAGEYKQASRDFAHVLARSFWYVAVPALIEAVVAHGGPNENKDEGWAEFAGKAILGEIPAGIPVMRDIAKAAIEGRDYEGSPIVNAVNSVLRGGKDIYQHVVDDKDYGPSAGKHIATAAGLVTGLPTAAPFTAGKFLWDINNGDADPQNLKEWLQGLATGKVNHE